MLKDIDLMVRLTDAVVKSTSLPVTVKTRLGWDDNTRNIEDVAERLQDVGIKALAIHGRTRTQMYKGEADWTLIGKVKNNPRITIPIFGNGDIDSPEKAVEYRNRYGVDGIMIGRAAIGYPWIFREIKHFVQTGEHLALMDATVESVEPLAGVPIAGVAGVHKAGVAGIRFDLRELRLDAFGRPQLATWRHLTKHLRCRDYTRTSERDESPDRGARAVQCVSAREL